MLDSHLTRVVIAILDLGKASNIEPVVATLDSVRKIEILKMYAKHITNAKWKKKIDTYIKKVEYVFQQRNLACHSEPVNKDGVWFLKPYAIAKILKNLNLKEKLVKFIPIGDLRKGISLGESAVEDGSELIKNFARVNAERMRRQRARRQASQRT